MKITVNRDKKGEVRIFCDGEYAFTTDADYWFSSPYCKTEELGEDDKAAFLRDVGSRSAFLAGLKLLSYSDQSKRGLIDKLTRKKYEREHAALAADRLEELGYIDDERYAERLAEDLFRRKGTSARGIRFALIQKGISKETAEKISESFGADQTARVAELLRGKFARRLSDGDGVKKTIASLRRLGYEWSDINSALREVEAETEDFEDV